MAYQQQNFERIGFSKPIKNKKISLRGYSSRQS